MFKRLIFPAKYVIPQSLSRLAIGQVSIWNRWLPGKQPIYQVTIDSTRLDPWLVPNKKRELWERTEDVENFSDGETR